MNREIIKIIVAGFLTLCVMISCLYFPLVASLLENQLLGTDRVYNAFDAIGLAEPLGVIYEPAVDVLHFLVDL